MSRTPAAFGLVSRLARREVRRRPWRTLLVALLIAIPVGIMSFSVVLVRTDSVGLKGAWQLGNGAADVVLMGTGDVTPPADATTVTQRIAEFRALRTTDGLRSRARITDLSLDSAITGSIVRINVGRAPTGDNEVLLSPDVAKDLGVHLGDVLHLERPSAIDVTVVGVGQLRSHLPQSLAIVAPGTSLLGADAQNTRTYIELAGGVDDPWLDELVPLAGNGPASDQMAEVAPYLRNAHPDLAALASPLEQDKPIPVRWVWVMGSMVATVTGIVVASAFAAGARRQLTTLGQLSANGAPPDVLRRSLFLQGTWVGLIGSGGGLALGAIGLVVFRSRLDGLFGRDLGGYQVRLVDFVPPVLIGVVAATIAALVPARTTSRVPVLAALAGRRPLSAVPRWVTGVGLATIVGGLGLFGLAILGGRNATENNGLWSFVAILGGMGVLLGACAVTPAYVGVLDWAGARLSGSWRFAARSLARQRTRTGAVVSAVCATSALAIL